MTEETRQAEIAFRNRRRRGGWKGEMVGGIFVAIMGCIFQDKILAVMGFVEICLGMYMVKFVYTKEKCELPERYQEAFENYHEED